MSAGTATVCDSNVDTRALSPSEARCVVLWGHAGLADYWVDVEVRTIGALSEKCALDAIGVVAGAHDSLRTVLLSPPGGDAGGPDVLRMAVRRTEFYRPPDRLPALPDRIDPAESAFAWALDRSGAAAVLRLRVTHILCDQLSTQLLAQQLTDLVEEGVVPARRPISRYSTSAAWVEARGAAVSMVKAVQRENAWTTGAVLRSSGDAPAPELRGAPLRLGRDTVTAVRRASRSWGVGETAVYTSAACLLFGPFHGTPAIAVRMQSANRSRPQDYEVVAQLAQSKVLPVRITEPTPSIRDLAKAIQQAMSETEPGPYCVQTFISLVDRQRLGPIVPFIEANVYVGNSTAHPLPSVIGPRDPRTGFPADIALHVRLGPDSGDLALYTSDAVRRLHDTDIANIVRLVQLHLDRIAGAL